MLIQKNEQLEEELVSIRQELLSSDRNDSSKEILVLKKVVKNLEVSFISINYGII